jgi:putative peptidoglycan lipid II flippase
MASYPSSEISDTKTSVFSSAKSFFVGTFLSRISGMVRDISMAFFFAASADIAAFMVAFRLANLLRRLLGEGTMHAGFVPFFETLRKDCSVVATKFYRDLFFSFVTMLVAIVAAMEILMVISGNVFNLSPSNMKILFYTEIMMPGLVFICLYSLNCSLLQCYRHYFLPAIAPIVFNVIWIASIFFVKNNNTTYAVVALSISVVMAFFMQYMITTPRVILLVFKNITAKQWVRPHLFSSSVRKLIKPITLGVIGVGAVQINSALDAVFARMADIHGPAYLWYAIRLQQLPLALFGVAIAGAILPPLARAHENNNRPLFKSFFVDAFSKNMALMIPFTIAVIVFGGSGVNLIFGHGMFSDTDTINTMYCLWGYSAGLFFLSSVLILSNVFYANKNYVIPMVASVLSVIVNVTCNAIFVFVCHYGAVSIAIATSISAVFNFVVLLAVLLRKDKSLFSTILFYNFLKIVAASLLAGAITYSIGYYYLNDPVVLAAFGKHMDVILPRDIIVQAKSVIILSSVFIASLLFVATILRINCITEIFYNKKAK